MSRRSRRIIGCLVIVGAVAEALQGCGSFSTAPAVRDGPGIELVGGARFEVQGLDSRLLAASPFPESWRDAFTVRVVLERTDAALPPVAGAYRREEGTLVFEPAFPIQPGVTYRATLDLSKLNHGGKSSVVHEDFRIPSPPRVPTSVVEAVYPTTDVLPENQLKFYIHFSAPMGRGYAYQNVRLLRADQSEVDLPFLVIDEELWDPEAKRFTLFFDPGRVKRELRPREEVGPALEQGMLYSLIVDTGWRDATGQPLKNRFIKRFRVGPPDYEQPKIDDWDLRAPRRDAREPLVLSLPEPLDHALLNRLVWVVGPDGGELPGDVEISDSEKRWTFTPRAPWKAGKHRLKAQTTLEDLAGNSIGRLFEIDVFEKVTLRVEVEIVERDFEIR